MAALSRVVRLFFSGRLREIDTFMRDPAGVQHKQLKSLISKGYDTVFGREYGFDTITDGGSFARNVPVFDYESIEPYIERTRKGEESVIWPGRIKWYAKSSGTTGSKSKFIPVTSEGLKNCHMRGPMDIVAIYADLFPDTKVFGGKTLTLGGSHRIEPLGDGSAMQGDLSAILIENTPKFARSMRVPKPATALIPDFEEKVKAIYKETAAQDVRSFAGVPSWNLVLMNKILEFSGKENILEVWPNMELFTHGGMNFAPYREQYKRILPSDRMRYMETYNASEGFFGIGDDLSRDDMLLMLDYGVYYEFLPMDKLSDHSAAVPLEGVRMGVNYAMIITTCNGLWRYMIGDTVEFTSTAPYRIKITGRTKHFINAFGEEIIIDNAETALKAACEATGAAISDYTAGPVYMGDKSKGSHEWIIEFSTLPSDIEKFREALDQGLQKVNSDYEAKRFKDTTLLMPKITVAPEGTFYRWMKDLGKTGGQNKVPRLANDRKYIEQLYKVMELEKCVESVP